jgi:hypothetical protein
MNFKLRSAPAAMAALALLAGCASAPPAPAPLQVRTVEAPIPVRCRPDLGPEPDYPDTDQALRAAPDLFARVRLLLAGRLLRIARDQQKSAALAACAG